MTAISGPYRERFLSRRRTIELVRELESHPADVTATSYISPGSAEIPGWEWLPPAAMRSPGGLVLVSGPMLDLAIGPPYEIKLVEGDTTRDGPSFGPLVSSLVQRRLIAFILLRLGAYAVGVADDENLVASKTGTRYVKGRHRAGGQSQRRFERNREEWISKLYDQVCAEVTTRFGPYERELHALATGGDRHVVEAFMKRCGFADRLRRRVTTIDVPVERPGLKNLGRAVTRAWGCQAWDKDRPR